ATRRRTQTARSVWSQYLKRTHAIHSILSATGHKHLQLVVGLSEGLALECHTDLMWSGFCDEADVLQAGIDPIQRSILHLIVELHVFFAADHSLVDKLIVDRHYQRVLVLHPIAPDVSGHVGDIDDVFAV